MPVKPAVIVADLMAAWLVIWWLAAAFSAKAVVRQPLSQRLQHQVFWVAGAILIFAPPRRITFLMHRLLPPDPWIGWVGAALTLIGVLYSFWARARLGRLWSASVTLKSGHSIVRSGPYGITRHPIYTGLVTAMLGALLAFNTRAALLGFVSLVIGVLIKIRQEEAMLSGPLGDEYRAYRAEVPMLVPGLSRHHGTHRHAGDGDGHTVGADRA